MRMNLQDEVTVAAQIAEQAGQLILSYVDSDRMQTQPKGARDLVTAADFASETLLVRLLTQAFPDDGIVAEEGSKERPAAPRRWYLDPLDGTVNFAHSVPVWCVSLGLFDGTGPLLGVIHDPIRRETFAAARGLGARCNSIPTRTSGVTRMDEALVHLTVDFHDDSRLMGLEDLGLLAPAVFRTRNLGSAALALAYVATGRLDAMLHRFANAWDYTAGVVLVQEAGGCVTAPDGTPYTERTPALLAAATGELHGALRETIRG